MADFVTRVASIENIPVLAGLLIVDGIPLCACDEILVKDQDDPTQNAIYTVSTGPWTARPEFIAGVDVGNDVYVLEGTLNSRQQYFLQSPVLTAFPRSPNLWSHSGVAAAGPLASTRDPVPDLDGYKNFYVSKDGFDGNAGSVASPFLTIQKAIDTLGAPATANDEAIRRIIHIDGGQYEEDLIVPVGGFWTFIASGRVFIGSFGVPRDITIQLDGTKQFADNHNFAFGSGAGIGGLFDISGDLIVDDTLGVSRCLITMDNFEVFGSFDATAFSGGKQGSLTAARCGFVGDVNIPMFQVSLREFSLFFGDLICLELFRVYDARILGDVSVTNGFVSDEDFKTSILSANVNLNGVCTVDADTLAEWFHNSGTLSGGTTFALRGAGPVVLRAVAPAITDDQNDGYVLGMVWIDTVANNAYICTDTAVGAAVWRLV